MPSTAGVPTMALATAPTVPSPPAATTIGEGPERCNSRAKSAASLTGISVAICKPIALMAFFARTSFALRPAPGLTTRISSLLEGRSDSGTGAIESHPRRAARMTGPLTRPMPTPMTAPASTSNG